VQVVALQISEFDAMLVEPRDAWAVLVEGGFAENWVVAAAIEGDKESAVRSHFNSAACLDELVVQQFRFRILESLQLPGQPAVAAVGDNG